MQTWSMTVLQVKFGWRGGCIEERRGMERRMDGGEERGMDGGTGWIGGEEEVTNR